MMKKLQVATMLVLAAGAYMSWSKSAHAAASGQLGVSATVAERCRVDFSEGSADYFQSCSSVDVKASERASNVLGELQAIAAHEDPYFLDRVPDTTAMATPAETLAAAGRRANAPKIVTIHY